VNGDSGDRETPLITAASYGDADVARVLIEAGADIEAVAADDAGGVPGGTALLHAGVFGMTDVVDVLVAAGARIRTIVEAAAAGDVTGFLTNDTPLDLRVRALTMAAGHDRVAVIETLLAAGTPVDAVDAWGSTALQAATENGRTASAAALVAAGAAPS
jgi:ankyrin repeat protein